MEGFMYIHRKVYKAIQGKDTACLKVDQVGRVVKKKLRSATQLRLAKIKESRQSRHPPVP